jgi:AmmeMemoRadiSam system protein B
MDKDHTSGHGAGRHNSFPRLRAIEPRPYAQDGQRSYWLRDPLQLSERALVVPEALAAALAFCDGTRDAGMISADFAARYGLRLPLRAVEQLLAALDEALLLDNPRSAQALADALEAFRREPCRPPSCAGQTYPADPGALRDALNGFLEETGNPEPRIAARGLVSPHIDYARGGRTYAQAWQRAARAAQEAELAIVVGTDHAGDDPFTLTRQHYATPYGALPTARDIVDGLSEALGAGAAFAGELRHRSEHSLELPLVWLHHMRQGQPCQVVPVLCGSLSHRMASGDPSGDPAVRAFLEAMPRLAAGRRVIVIASGDLAHVGPAFGGSPVDAAGCAQLKRRDSRLMSRIAAGDAEGFFGAIARVENRDNVCGTAPIYLAMKLLEASAGEPVGYDQCPADEAGASYVSICGALLE